MGGPVVLVVNSTGRESDWVASVRAFSTVHRVHSADELNGRIRLHCPHALCFEFEKYDPAILALILRTRQAHPSLPVLMITGEHSEELAVWALRARVWDYIVKPVLVQELYCSLMTIHQLVTTANEPRAPRIPEPVNRLLARAAAPNRRSRAEVAVGVARDYIARHLGEKFTGADLAGRCAMSYYHFSRTFRRVTGMTPRDYILRERIGKAAQLLRGASGFSVTAAAYAVGFRDLSYFARMFRRYQGVSPSQYRQTVSRVAEAAESARALHADRPI